jgi:antirestriction protein ArdC
MSTATDEARAHRLEQMHETLVAQTEALVTSEGWIKYLDFAARFRQYSLNNTLLILAQMPEATRVASYKKWAEVGRQVRKGEKSLSIFAPMTRKRETATGEEKTYVSGFRLVPVFDVSQTDGDPMPEEPRPVLLEGEEPEGMLTALVKIANLNGYLLRFGPSTFGENGYTDKVAKMVQLTEGLSDAQRAKTMAHEVAHILLHCENEERSGEARIHRGIAEVEAESVAYLVATALGMTTDAYSLPYIAGWSDGNSAAVAATADRVLKTAKAILAEVEKTVEVVPA